LTANLAATSAPNSNNANGHSREPNQVSSRQTSPGGSVAASAAANNNEENGDNPFSRASLQKRLKNIVSIV